jgi:hypothetical protein
MATPQESSTIQVYFKIPFTDITTTCLVNNSLTTLEFMEYVDVEVRNNLNINPRYDIEIVDIDKPRGELATCMEPRNDETLLQRYNRVNQLIALYARPVHPITREFIRRDNYSE